MLGTLLKKFAEHRCTCPITDIQDRCVTFIRDEKYLPYLRGIKEDVWVIAPPEFKNKISEYQANCCPTVKAHYTDWPEFEFAIFHNKIHERDTPTKPYIGNNCNIHPTVIMDVDGLKLVHCPNGEKIQFKHIGHIMIADNVDIGPYTVIHRGTMGITSIKTGCKIGAKNNIGHNCSLGSGTVLAVGVILNGGVYTGVDCWFGSGSIVKHHTTITDNVILGHGAVTTKDILKPGIYVGNPARFLKEAEKGWNF